MTLVNRKWQSAEGTRQIRLYPYLRRPDVLSSNAYVFDTPDWIVLIDPGAQEEQSQELFDVIRGLMDQKPRPLLIFLTHCHIDHALHAGLHRAFRTEAPVWLAVHRNGAQTLSTGDPERTAAGLYNIDFEPIAPDILFAPPATAMGESRREIVLPGEHSISVTTVELKTSIAAPFFRKIIPLGGDDVLEWYHTPGHSPDSACIRVGRLLFIGDILSAVNPFVAGIAGWSQRDFIHSTSHVAWLLENSEIDWCCPGHGNAMASQLVVDLLRKVRGQAEKLADVEEMNVDRLHRATEQALEMIGEMEEVFAAMAGRLALLAFHLENLDEERIARQYRELLDADAIEEGLRNLRGIARDLEAGQRLEVDFAIRALAIFQKIKTLFDREKLRGIVPTAISGRAQSLLLDFVNFAKGAAQSRGARGHGPQRPDRSGPPRPPAVAPRRRADPGDGRRRGKIPQRPGGAAGLCPALRGGEAFLLAGPVTAPGPRGGGANRRHPG